MILRIEFPASKSPNFAQVLGVCRRLTGFKEVVQDDAPLYTIEFKDTDFDSAQAVIDFIRSWRMVTFYIDGKLTARMKALRIVWDMVFKEYSEDAAEHYRRREVERGLLMKKLIREANTPRDITGLGDPPPPEQDRPPES